MRLVHFITVILIAFSSQLSLSQNESSEMIHLNLLIPKELATEQAFDKTALDTFDRAVSTLNNKMVSSAHCVDCDTYATGNEPSVDFMFGTGGVSTIDGQKARQIWDAGTRISKVISDNCLRVDSGILNEGHPQVPQKSALTNRVYSDSHHRDEAYLQITCRKEVLKKLYGEVSLGPAFTMDTTSPNGGAAQDQKGLAILATVALKYYLGNSGWHARFECDEVKETNLFNRAGPKSTLCMAGIGKDFGLPTNGAFENILGDGINLKGISMATGVAQFKTSHVETRPSEGSTVEFSKIINESWQARLGFLTTGDDGAVNDDRGVSADLDYLIPVGRSGRTSIYSGAGVYLDRNYKTEKFEISPTFTFIGVQHDFGNNMFVRVDYDRIARSNNATVGKRQGGDMDEVRTEFGYRF